MLSLKLKIEDFLLLLILSLGIFLKLWKISDLPLISDEAIFGLTAFEMIETGTITLSMGEYRGPMGAYVLLPSIYLFGKNLIAVRTFILILSVFSMILCYIYIKKLYNVWVALASSFIFTIIPRNLVLSISMMEFGLLLFFMLLVNYLFNKYNETKNLKFLLLASLFSGFGIITRLTFLFFLISFILTSRLILNLQFKLNKINLCVCILSFLIGILPMLIYNLTNNFATIGYILKNFPKTSDGVNLLNIRENLWKGTIRFYHYFSSDNFLVLMLFIFALFIFVIPILKEINSTISKKNLFIFSNFIILFVLLSLLTVSNFRPQDFILISPYYSIILGYFFYDIQRKLKKFKIYFYSFPIFFICILSLIYLRSYLNLVTEIQENYRCNVGVQLMSAILPSLKYSKIVTSIGHLQYIVMWYANTSIDVNENRLLYLIRDKEPLGLIVTRLNKLMKSRDVIYIFSVNEVCGSTEPEKIFIDFLKSHNKTVSEEIEIYHNEEIMFKIYKV